MKRTLSLIFAVVSLAFVSACGESKPETASPASYDKAGVTFQYPQNWKVTQDEEDGAVRSLIVESTGDALFIMQIFSTTDIIGVGEFAENFAKAAVENTPIGSITSSKFSDAQNAGGYEILTERFGIDLLGQHVPHTREYRRKAGNKGVVFLISQTANEDASTVAPGFELIAKTLKSPVSD